MSLWISQGFARYSTDRKWHVPHFEKMLYDQAQLVQIYTSGYLYNRNQIYLDTVKDILTYVKRDLGSEEGGFFSAEDADSYPSSSSKEKKEGAFYAFTKKEIVHILDAKKSSQKEISWADIFCHRFGVKENGNVDPLQDPHDELKHQNVLYQASTFQQIADKLIIPVEEVKEIVQESVKIVFDFRNTNRPRPGLDTKIITSWNGE